MDRRQLRIVLDIVFPPTTHGRLLRDYSPDRFAQHLKPQPVGTVIALAKYSVPVVQAAVAACKFEQSRYAAVLMSKLFLTWLKLNQVPGITLLIAIPLSTQRQKERGFNQITRVLEYLPHMKNMNIKSQLLVRIVDTVRQTSLGRRERLTNTIGAFTAIQTITHYDWTNVTRVILCDDVVTTGATLEAARAVLAPHLPAHIELLLVAWTH